MTKKIESILPSLFFIVLFILLYHAMIYGINKGERIECEEWQEWAEEYPAYQSTEWQRQQCKHHGLPLER